MDGPDRPVCRPSEWMTQAHNGTGTAAIVRNCPTREVQVQRASLVAQLPQSIAAEQLTQQWSQPLEITESNQKELSSTLGISCGQVAVSQKRQEEVARPAAGHQRTQEISCSHSKTSFVKWNYAASTRNLRAVDHSFTFDTV
jgi:hypothetical protein